MRRPLLAVLLALTLTSAACASTSEKSNPRSASSSAQGTTDDSVESAAPSASSNRGDAGPASSTTSRGRGAPASNVGGPARAGGALLRGGPAIKIGYAIIDLTGFSAISGSGDNRLSDESADQNKAKARRELAALVKWANRTGGVGGRKIEAIPFDVPNTDALSDDALQAHCVKATEDSKVKAFLDSTVIVASPAAVACFAKHKVNFVGVTQADGPYMADVRPFVGTTNPVFDRSFQGYVQGLKAVGYFKGAKLGVVMDDRAITTRGYRRNLLPALKASGVKVLETATINPTDQTLQQTQAASAVLRFKNAGVTHVLPLLYFFTYLAFTSQASSQGYFPRYGFGEHFTVAGAAAFYGSADQNRDAVAVSSVPGIVVETNPGTTSRPAKIDRKKALPGLRRCYDIISKETGVDYYTFANQGTSVVYYCDHFFLWLEAARKVGASWTPQIWAQGLGRLARSYQSSFVNSTNFFPGRFDGAASYRAGKYFANCKCFVKQTDWTPLP